DSWDVLLPAWREDPRRLAAILQGESTARPAVEETHQPNPKVRRCGLEGIVEKFVRIVKTDDAEHLFGGRLLAVARSLILEAGRRLVSHGVLTKVHQVFGLTVEEVKRCLADPPDYSMAPYAQEHLRILDRMRSRTLPHFLNRRDPIDHISDSGAGVPVSAGCVEGQLRIVRTVEDLQDLSADTILALVSPNPAYIPFFSQVGGLVCETGGLLSHSFVVARELMLPAVTQVKGLTRHYKSGDRVRMDGATGQLKKVACDA
ncbi:MAG: hypothetical protein KDK78_08935, partial [Chlamydiia bacterium]|nr:hypothetical protein [Chlamydiia bacterium]